MKLNEGPLAVELFLIGRGTHSLILAVRQHHARLHIVAQVRGEHDILQITLGLRIIDRRHNLYAAIAGAYRERFGDYAGWAQQYLFHARRVGRALPMPSTVKLRHA